MSEITIENKNAPIGNALRKMMPSGDALNGDVPKRMMPSGDAPNGNVPRK